MISIANEGGLVGHLEKNMEGIFDSYSFGDYNVAENGVCCLNNLEKNDAILGFIANAMENRRINIMRKGLSIDLESHGVFIASTEPNKKFNEKNPNLCSNYKLADSMYQRFNLIVNIESIDQDIFKINKKFQKISLDRGMFETNNCSWPDEGLANFESLSRNFLSVEVCAKSLIEDAIDCDGIFNEFQRDEFVHYL